MPQLILKLTTAEMTDLKIRGEIQQKSAKQLAYATLFPAGHVLRSSTTAPAAPPWAPKKRAYGPDLKYLGGHVPYGYKIAANGYQLEIDPFEQSVITRARELRALGHSYAKITSELNAMGARSKWGNPIGLNTVMRLLMEVRQPETHRRAKSDESTDD